MPSGCNHWSGHCSYSGDCGMDIEKVVDLHLEREPTIQDYVDRLLLLEKDKNEHSILPQNRTMQLL